MNTFRCVISLVFITMGCFEVYANDLGFRFQEGRCQNSDGHLGLNPDFVGECGNLVDVDLSEQDLSSRSFVGANLVRVNLDRSDLSLSDFSYATLTNVSLIESTFRSLSLNYIDAESLVIESPVECENFSINSARISNSEFKSMDCVNSSFLRASISDSSLENVLIKKTFLDSSDFSNCDISQFEVLDSTAEDVVISSSRISGVKFENSDLIYARFNNLTGSSIEMKNLSVMFSVFVGLRGSDLLSFDGVTIAKTKFFEGVTNFDATDTHIILSEFDNFQITQGFLDQGTFQENRAVALNMENFDVSSVRWIDNAFSAGEIKGVNFTDLFAENNDYDNVLFLNLKFSNSISSSERFHSGSTMDRVKFLGFEGREFSVLGGMIRNSSFDKSQFVDSSFLNILFDLVVVETSQFTRSDFTGSKWLDMELVEGVFEDSLFSELSIENSYFEKLSLTESNFSGAIFHSSTFKGGAQGIACENCFVIDSDLEGLDPLIFTSATGSMVTESSLFALSRDEIESAGFRYVSMDSAALNPSGSNVMINVPTHEFKFELEEEGFIQDLSVTIDASDCGSDFDDYSIEIHSPSGLSVMLQKNNNADPILESRGKRKVKFSLLEDVVVPELSVFFNESAKGEWKLVFLDDDSDQCKLKSSMFEYSYFH